MILINLLPHRERAREKARRDFRTSMVGSAVLGGLVAVLIYLLFQHQIDNQNERNQFLRDRVAALNAQIKEVDGLDRDIADLEARQNAVQSLQTNRNLAVRLLSGVVEDLPDGMFLSQIKQQGNDVQIEGMAQSNERVSELLRNLSRSDTWIAKPELLEIAGSELQTEGGQKQRAYKFTVRFQLRPSRDVKPASSEASGSGAHPPLDRS